MNIVSRTLRVQGLEQGLGFRVQGLGVHGQWCRAACGFRVQGLGFGLSLGCSVWDYLDYLGGYVRFGALPKPSVLGLYLRSSGDTLS